MPLQENNGYNAAYKKILFRDLANHPPVFIILNKNNYRSLNLNDFYTQIVTEKLKSYSLSFENDRYLVYKRNGETMSYAPNSRSMRKVTGNYLMH